MIKKASNTHRQGIKIRCRKASKRIKMGSKMFHFMLTPFWCFEGCSDKWLVRDASVKLYIRALEWFSRHPWPLDHDNFHIRIDQVAPLHQRKKPGKKTIATDFVSLAWMELKNILRSLLLFTVELKSTFCDRTQCNFATERQKVRTLQKYSLFLAVFWFNLNSNKLEKTSNAYGPNVVCFVVFHPQIRDVRWIVFNSDKPLQKNEKILNTVAVISLLLLNVPYKISSYKRVDFGTQNKRTGTCTREYALQIMCFRARNNLYFAKIESTEKQNTQRTSR